MGAHAVPSDRPDIALVVGSHGRHALIETSTGQRLRAHPRGKKNAGIVGDLVRWQPAGDEAVIEALQPRRNLLRRQDEWRSKSFAANLDQLLIMVACEPMFSESQLARALIAAEDADIPATLLLNKTDLPCAALARERLAPYRAMGLAVVEVALKTSPQAAREALFPCLDGRASLLLGPSGTGKSTLINLMVAQANAQVGDISAALGSGRHTTTTTTWYWLDGATVPAGNAPRRGALIDSPGFQEFGLMHIEPQNLAALMPDLRPYLGGCRYYNCSHRQEPGCTLQAAAKKGRISASRMQIYTQLRNELEARQQHKTQRGAYVE